MTDCPKTRHRFTTKTEPGLDTVRRVKSRIQLDENLIKTGSEQSSFLHRYVHILKCLMCFFLIILRCMFWSFMCSTGAVAAFIGYPCQINKVRAHELNESYLEEEACGGSYSSRDTPHIHPKVCKVKEPLQDCSKLESSSSACLNDSDTTESLCLNITSRDANSIVLPANLNESHKYQESEVQSSLRQSSIFDSTKHNAESKHAPEVAQTGLGNTSNTPSTNVYGQETDSKHQFYIASTSTYKNEGDSKHGVHNIEDGKENLLGLDSLSNTDSDCIGNPSLGSLKDCSNLESGSSTCLTDSETTETLYTTTRNSNSVVLPANSSASHTYLKTQGSEVQHSLRQSSSTGSVKHNAEIKHVSKVGQTGLGNAPKTTSTKVYGKETDSEHKFSIAATSTHKNKAEIKHDLRHTEGSKEKLLGPDSSPSADSGCTDNASLEPPKDSSNLKSGSLTCLTYSDTTEPLCLNSTTRDSNSLVLLASSNASHKYFKTQESQIQDSLDQNSTNGSVKHNTETKHVPKIGRIGLVNTSNIPISKVHREETDSKHQFSIASTSTYEKETDSKHGVHHTEGSKEKLLGLDCLPNTDSDYIGNASFETDHTFRWQEPDDSIALRRSNKMLKNKLNEIVQPFNLVNINETAEAASLSQSADKLCNVSDNPIRIDSVMPSEKYNSMQEVMQVNTALADSFLEKDDYTDELLYYEFILKKCPLSRSVANPRCPKIFNGRFYNHSVGNMEQYLENAIASNVFSDLYDINVDETRNHYYADKAPSTSEFSRLENTNITCDGIQLNNERSFLCNPKMMDEHNVELDVVSKGILAETYQIEGAEALDKPQDLVPSSEFAETPEAENAAAAEGEDEGGNEPESENQGEEGGNEGGGSGQGGEGGQEEGDAGEIADYVMIMMRAALGPSVDEAVLDTVDVVKRVGEFFKGSTLQDGGEGEGSSGGEGNSGGNTEGGEDEDKSA